MDTCDDKLAIPKYAVGLITGRFQPLHYGHFEFIDRAIEHSDILYIGITNPTSELNHLARSSSNRNKREANIFTYEERRMMVEGLFNRYFRDVEKHVIPFELGDAPKIMLGLPSDAVVMHTVYDDWSLEKESILRREEGAALVLWKRGQKITTGTMVRRALSTGDEWEHLVPLTTRRVILQIGLEEIRHRLLSARDSLEEEEG